MKTVFILKGSLEALPPLIPRILLFSKKNIKTMLICTSISERNKSLFKEYGIEYLETKHNDKLFGKNSRVLDWSGFKNYISKFMLSNHEDTIYYIGSADTALCLGSLLNDKKYILQSNELYDK